MAFAHGYPMAGLMRMREATSRLSQPSGGPGNGEEGAWGQATWMPPVDIYETEDGYVLEAELPGFTTEDLDIELVENRLTLRGERKPPSTVKEEPYRRHERAYGRFERSFLLPAVIDRDHVTAEMHHGVLTLRLPKSDLAKPKRIPIREAEWQGALSG
jgi:HSP20 family protein